MGALRKAFREHSRRWRDFRYVYPVIARRSRGLSLGINLNPDQVCSFNCIYCCVDRPTGRRAQHINLSELETELKALAATSEQLFQEPEFREIPPEYRRLNDFAFSGDGEPTSVPVFPLAVRIAAGARSELHLRDVKIVLITNAAYLNRAPVVDALRLLDESNGEIWAKLDAGTPEYFAKVNRSRFELDHVLANILATAKVRPIVIQSLFMRIAGEAPPPGEVTAYLERLRGLLKAGAQLKGVQVYTVARKPPTTTVEPLPAAELEEIAARVRGVGVPATVYP